MTERAARPLTEVLPRVPVRQWVLSLPCRLRYQLAWNHELCLAVLGVFARALLEFYRRRARRQRIVDGRTGTLTIGPSRSPHRACQPGSEPIRVYNVVGLKSARVPPSPGDPSPG